MWIYTPAGYSRTGPPSDLIVLLDGRIYIDRLLAPVTLDNLLAAGRIDSTVAVFVDNPPQARNDELPGNPIYADFLATELPPWIRMNFNVTEDSSRVIVGGASAGGVGAAYAALRHSSAFGNVLSQSAGFALSPERRREFDERASGGDRDNHVVEELEDRSVTEGAGWIARLFIDAPRRQIRLYLDVGVFEADFLGGGLGALEPNRHIRDVLRGTFADGVMALLAKKLSSTDGAPAE